jgi:hypothetical protein
MVAGVRVDPDSDMAKAKHMVRAPGDIYIEIEGGL